MGACGSDKLLNLTSLDSVYIDVIDDLYLFKLLPTFYRIIK
jgi:hypothetical protein